MYLSTGFVNALVARSYIGVSRMTVNGVTLPRWQRYFIPSRKKEIGNKWVRVRQTGKESCSVSRAVKL